MKKRTMIFALSILLLGGAGRVSFGQGQALSQGTKGAAMEQQLTAEQIRQDWELKTQAGRVTQDAEEKQGQLSEQEAKWLKVLAEERLKKEQSLAAAEKKALAQKMERQKSLADEEARLRQSLEARQRELVREIETRRMQIMAEEARQLQEIRRKQEQLARKTEERQRALALREAERSRKVKEREVHIVQRRQDELEKMAQDKARKQAEFAQREQERVAKIVRRQQEIQSQRENEARRIEEAKRKEEERREEIVRQQEMNRQRLSELQIKQEEERLRLTQKEQGSLERAAKSKEIKEKEKAWREEESRLKQEQAEKEKEWRRQQAAAQKSKGKQEVKYKTQAKEKQAVSKLSAPEKNLKAKEEQLEKQKLEKQMSRLKAKEEELSREKEKWLDKVAVERSKRNRAVRARREQEEQSREMKLMLAKERRLRKEAELKAERQEESQSRDERLAQEKAPLQATERDQAIAKKMSNVQQEKTVSKTGSAKQVEDAAKIRKADALWIRARKLYSAGMYEQAVRDFQEIVKIEGNPRIKYTPAAKDYIEKANAKMEQSKQADFEKQVERRDTEMLNEATVRTLAPYAEPPEISEKEISQTYFEPPLIRKQLREKKISMDFDQVDIKSVISFLSQESGVNFIASQKVLEMGLKVTARFEQTPLDEVVKYITKGQGLLYRIDKEVVWIAHPEEIAQEALETRVYYLIRGGGLFTEFSGTAGGTTESGLGSSSGQINKIVTIEDTLKEVVSWPQDAKLTFDKRINALIVRNTPQNLQMLEDILYSLDVVPYQILIEARFLEVDVTDTKELGLEWKFNDDFAIEQKDGEFSHGVAKNSGADFSNFAGAAQGLNLTYQGVLTTPQFQVALHALQENKKIKTLSSPRVTTLNNQLATIKVVDEWIYPTRYDYEIVQFDTNGDGDFNDANETLYQNVPKDFIRRDVGILLKVIPSIGTDRKTISLSLIPEVSEATADYFSYTGDVKLPLFTSRNLSTTIVVNSGDTVVLGGLIKESHTKINTKVPLIGDIPFLGRFFNKDTDSVQRKNLLIFVTAKMLTPAGEEVVVK
jgi:type II secretory pathway component GspD/PulD (secretin)